MGQRKTRSVLSTAGRCVWSGWGVGLWAAGLVEGEVLGDVEEVKEAVVVEVY